MMKTREPLHPEFGIARTIEAFRQPPCPPPQGKEVMERFFEVFHAQLKNERSADAASYTVAVELDSLWKLGDARIPRKTVQTIKKKIMDFRDNLRKICVKSKKGQRAYEEAVSLRAGQHFQNF